MKAMVIIHVGHFIAQYIFLVQLYPRTKFYDRMKRVSDKMWDYKKIWKPSESAFFTFKIYSKDNKSHSILSKMTIAFAKGTTGRKAWKKDVNIMIWSARLAWIENEHFARDSALKLQRLNTLSLSRCKSQWEIAFENHKIGINQEES